MAEVQKALEAGRSVVVDNTNPGKEQRAPVIELAKTFGATVVACYFEVNINTCLTQNRKREPRSRVPDVGIFATRKKFSPPVHAEGFAAIYRVTCTPVGLFTTEKIPFPA